MATKASTTPDRLNAEAAIQALTADSVTKLQTYELAKLEQQDVLCPTDTKARLLHEIASSTNLAEIAALQTAIAKFTGPDAEAVRNATYNAMVAEYEPARLSLIALCDGIDTALAGYKATAVVDETSLFTSYGLARNATTCSTRFDAVINTFRGYRADLVSPGWLAAGSLPAPQHPVMTYLGVTV